MSSKEQIQSLLDAGHNKELRDEIVSYVGKSASRMKALMFFFFHEKWRYGQRAAWAIGEIGVQQPNLIRPYLEKMVSKLDEETHNAVKRNIVRIFEEIDVPEDLEGRLFDTCLGFVIEPKYAVAIRCYSITICGKIAEKYPDLQGEILAIAHEYMPHGSAGIKFRFRKLIAKFS